VIRNSANSVDATPALRLLESRRPLVIGHRGFAHLAPENTLPSFKLALEAGADVVELDCRQTRDGQLIVFHDGHLDRTTDAAKRWGKKKIRVESKTAAELQTLDAGSWFDPKFAGAKVPLLGEALDLINGAGHVTLIERKSGDAAAYVKLLRDKSLVNQVVMIAFDWQFLCAFRELEPGQVFGALGPPTTLANGRRPRLKSRRLSAAWLDLLKSTGARLVVWNKHVTAASVKVAHERGLKVWVYTIDDPGLANKLLGMGVDGIITNNPALIARKVASLFASHTSK
jgi:glycerophosphoryl diester phosphodiesterase